MFYRSIEVLDCILQKSNLQISRTDEESACIAMSIKWAPHLGPYISLIRKLFPHGVSLAAAKFSSSTGLTMLHCALDIWCRSFYTSRHDAHSLSEMRLIIRNLVAAGSDPHAPAYGYPWGRGSPMAWAAYGAYLFSRGHVILDCTALPEVLRVWLEILSEAGVDLVEYGKTSQKENRQLFNSDLELNFSYGSKVEDWTFCYTRVGPLQQPKQKIPGAWVSDDT